ncbi:Acetate transporter ActP [Achromobacter spanius]|uniref:sodium:solute symporter family protein n=1 Tax=Achromobacter spanius TaxID=217203 RepID=UPI000C2C54E2|nr:sodium:solute symporter family protein [Achromobacter spanius]AUA54605.1 cation acetate symporter [Achromobacter spanius]CAB3650587.1 Cation/acetate symporter ActP [Achromobacter spanius]SPT39806.1 Acetate transporter ActP [Achromobacter denitrificans]VEE58000.1 Acetate transporter ActP [Achromobacter spanius]
MPFFSGDTPQEFKIRLRRIYVLYTAGFALMILLLALAEVLGMPRNWIGYVFLLVTVSLYAGIGIVCRTSDQVEYYVAGRRVPAIYNGMATAADWMSVASFIGVAGTLYLTGYGGLAYILGWTGGYVLVAMLLAPYLRRFGQYTIPDFMGARYGGNLPRLAGVACAILCSFTYLVAQIYGVGIITTRMTGISFELGIFVALGGMLVCSFLGGMRAVTWTQVGQYIILVIAYLVPVVWLSVKHTNMPVPQLSAGVVLQQVTEKEIYLQNDPSEIEVRRLWQQHADEMAKRVQTLPESWTLEKDKLRSRLAQLSATEAPMVDIRSVERELAAYPASVEDARVAWSQARATFEARAAPATPHAEPFPAKDPEEQRNMRINFLALVLCLMLGTAGMPHILMRSYTTPSVIEARKSVCWSLLFILLLYFMAPALALLVKYEVYTQVVGSNFLSLPNWVHAWSAVDSNLLDVTDINRDGVVQLSEISMGADVVVLAMPEIGGLPYVISGLVAAGGLAAALSTADGLLLTLSNSLSHDMWYRMVSPRMSAARRVMVSKILLLVVAFGAAWVAARKPADILFMVSAAFSFAASSFFPALVMGVFWRRANKWGATLGMAAGLLVTFAYMTYTHPWLRESVLGISRIQPVDLWWGIQPIAAGVFGAPVAFLTIIVVSLLTPPPDSATVALVDYLRRPGATRPPAESS